MRMRRRLLLGWLLCVTPLAAANAAPDVPGERPALQQAGVTITQEEIEQGQLPLQQIRRQGRLVFSTPFNKADGYGDGPMNPAAPTSPGGRPTLQNNGTFMRVNGLDSQSCLECHSVVSTRTIPATFGIGGVGGASANALSGPHSIDVSDEAANGFAAFDGRFINPPFLFGSGGVQLLASEMTADLQALAALAREQPDVDVPLVTKGVDFGSVRFSGGVLDTSNVVGVDPDLVVRPFGRKGQFATVRAFDVSALAFHFGIQPVEVVGAGVDADGDGVADEIGIGPISALEIFATTLEPPHSVGPRRRTLRGEHLFDDIGCTECHRPALETNGRILSYRFPESDTDPAAGVYYEVDLSAPPVDLASSPSGGLVIPLFADLKRHNMGPGLSEATGGSLDVWFTTARLWGVADTAPYLHDGRAMTLDEAIRLHGGEALSARDAYEALRDSDQASLLAFLGSLRTPARPSADLDH
jgi:Di-haem oxidoreductase, putative peroxidase